MKLVKSSNVAGMQYSRKTKTLSVVFTDFNQYEYYNVPRNLADGLRKAESKGKYLSKEIKGKYTYKKVGQYE